MCYREQQDTCSKNCCSTWHYRCHKSEYIAKSIKKSNEKWAQKENKEEKIYKMPLEHPWKEPIKNRARSKREFDFDKGLHTTIPLSQYLKVRKKY